MLRVNLIGPGDVEFHYQKLLRISKQKLEEETDKIARALKSANTEICLLPDKGICFELAKKFNKYGGRVIGLVPQQDTIIGIKHLQEQLETKIFNEIIDTGNWYKHDLTICLFGDAVLCLGLSPGTDGERAYGIYLYKLISKFKKGVNTDTTKLHPQARAGLHIPYTILMYKPFLKTGRLSEEEEAYIKKFGIDLVYIKSASELEKKLKNLRG